MVLLHLTSDMQCVSYLPVCTAGTANRLIFNMLYCVHVIFDEIRVFRRPDEYRLG